MGRSCSLRALGQSALFFLSLALLAFGGPARAAPLTLSIDDPVQFAAPGDSLSFHGTVTNNTGGPLDAFNDLFLNFGGFDASVLSFTQVLGVPDFTLPDGSTSAHVELFVAQVDPSAPAQALPYQADVTVSDTAGDISDPVTISITVPEPGSLPLLLTALGLLVVGFRPKGGRS